MGSTSDYYQHWETTSAYRVRQDVLQKWLRSLFNDEQIKVHETDDSQYGFWLVRPLTKVGKQPPGGVYLSTLDDSVLTRRLVQDEKKIVCFVWRTRSL